MAEYIDREAVDKSLEICVAKADAAGDSQSAGAFLAMRLILRDFPTADVVEVVRCRECSLADAYGHCEMQNFWGTRDDYCSRGRRLTNG